MLQLCYYYYYCNKQTLYIAAPRDSIRHRCLEQIYQHYLSSINTMTIRRIQESTNNYHPYLNSKKISSIRMIRNNNNINNLRLLVGTLLLLLLCNSSILFVTARRNSAFQTPSTRGLVVLPSKGQQKQQQHLKQYGKYDTSSIPTSTTTTTFQRQYSRSQLKNNPTSSTSLNMFMGSDGGLLGIGGPEVVTILLVGYFVLGPSDLYKLVKEIGKFIQNIQSLGTDLTKTFETNMNDVVQIEELRKAQRELNDAFSFRRSINVDTESEAFTVQAGSAQKNMDLAAADGVIGSGTLAPGLATAAGSSDAAASGKKRKVRRRVLKRPEPDAGVPDLEMPGLTEPTMVSQSTTTTTEPAMTAEEIAEIEREFERYTMTPENEGDFISSKQCYDDDEKDESNKLATTTTTTKKQQQSSPVVQVMDKNPVEKLQEQSRFQQQLSGNWNNKILQNEDKLEPIALVMNKIALLEQEKKATLQRLEEEYQKRQEIEAEYYKQQRVLLEQAATQIQEEAFGVSNKK